CGDCRGFGGAKRICRNRIEIQSSHRSFDQHMTTAAAIGIDFRTANTLWSSVLVETLRRSGLRQAVISPGSRSTSLTMAFVRHPAIECIPVLDERSAAFFALGLAKRSKTPVVLLCT